MSQDRNTLGRHGSRDIRAVLSDESWGDFWNWLVYVRDVNDGLGRGAESIKRLPYPYRRVANPLNVVCSPAMGFSRSDLLNAILGTCQQPRNLEDLEEVLSSRGCSRTGRLSKGLAPLSTRRGGHGG